MNKTKAKGLIKKLEQINQLTYKIENELNFENILGHIYDYVEITIMELKQRYHIK